MVTAMAVDIIEEDIINFQQNKQRFFYFDSKKKLLTTDAKVLKQKKYRLYLIVLLDQI